MRLTTFKTLSLAAVLTTFSLALVNASEPDTTLKDIAGYRQWTRVNEKPIPVESLSFAG
jgi:hypothetical protein